MSNYQVFWQHGPKYTEAEYTFVDDVFEMLFDDLATDVYVKKIRARNSNSGDERWREQEQQRWRLTGISRMRSKR
jgi:hypothetical protein